MKRVKTLHDDVVVIIVVIANFEVHKIVIDSSSAIDILFYDTFLRMKFPKEKFKPA